MTPAARSGVPSLAPTTRTDAPAAGLPLASRIRPVTRFFDAAATRTGGDSPRRAPAACRRADIAPDATTVAIGASMAAAIAQPMWEGHERRLPTSPGNGLAVTVSAHESRAPTSIVDFVIMDLGPFGPRRGPLP